MWFVPEQSWRLTELFAGFAKASQATLFLGTRGEAEDFMNCRDKFYLEPDHVGPVYPLEQALEELSSPYYLLGAELKPTKYPCDTPNHDVQVGVFMGDLEKNIQANEAYYKGLGEKLRANLARS